MNSTTKKREKNEKRKSPECGASVNPSRENQKNGGKGRVEFPRIKLSRGSY